jgi:hypothetical protein
LKFEQPLPVTGAPGDSRTITARQPSRSCTRTSRTRTRSRRSALDVTTCPFRRPTRNCSSHRA